MFMEELHHQDLTALDLLTMFIIHVEFHLAVLAQFKHKQELKWEENQEVNYRQEIYCYLQMEEMEVLVMLEYTWGMVILYMQKTAIQVL